MLISYKYKFIFVHNPKAAGTSVKHALKEYSLINPLLLEPINRNFNKTSNFYVILRTVGRRFLIPSLREHDTALEIMKEMKRSKWKSFFKFGFVRNPWDNQVSTYHYIKKTKKHILHSRVRNFTFDQWLNYNLRVSKNMRGRQKKYFYNDKAECIVDFIGKLENIQNDFDKVCEKIGIKVKLPHKNKSKHKPYQEYYNKYTKNLVAKHFKEDIELFNYKF